MTNIVMDINREHAHRLLKDMFRIRVFEEKCAELYSATKIRGFLHLYIGEEAVAVGMMNALTPEDSIVATYREHGHAIARGMSMNPLMAEMYGKKEGCSKGRGGSMHVYDAALKMYGGNAIVGGGLPLSVGLAMADKKLKRNHVTVCFFGDGAVAEGEFHESLNLAALWKLPVLFVCENNQYGMGTALELSESETDIHLKAESYKIDSEIVDGMDVIAVEQAAKRAVAAIKAGYGPYFLEIRTFRFRAHSMYDPELYREKSEVEEWKKKGPIITFIERLKANDLIKDEEIETIKSEVEIEVQASVDFAEKGTWESFEDMVNDVYSGGVPS